MTASLDDEALALFARKGLEAGASAAQVGEANGVKVRRVIQVTRDLASAPLSNVRILDLGCGDGVYAIEAALHGAQVVAVDARTARMSLGEACAARHGITTVRFVQDDIRQVSSDTYGTFDVVYLLGILYHLDVPDVFGVLENVHDLCRQAVVVDAFVSPTDDEEVVWRGESFGGRRFREHDDADSADVRESRVLKSIDNTFSFRFTKPALIRVLHAAGFTTVFECHVPREPHKPDDRVTVVGLRGEPVRLATYPWVNERSEVEIERRLRPAQQ